MDVDKDLVAVVSTTECFDAVRNEVGSKARMYGVRKYKYFQSPEIRKGISDSQGNRENFPPKR